MRTLLGIFVMLPDSTPCSQATTHRRNAGRSNDANAQLQSVTTPESGTSTVTYDALGNLWTATSPLGFVSTSHKDGWGRDTLVLTPIDSTHDQRQRVVYDVLGRVDSTISIGPSLPSTAGPTPAESLFVHHVYDDSGNLLSVARRTGPDPTGEGVDTTLYTYDNAYRQETQTSQGRTTTTVYDPAGNPIETTTPRNNTLRMAYDAAGRLKRRITPQVTYTQSGCAVECPIIANFPWRFPAYPNDGGDGLRIAADVATFTYDAMGNLRTARNGESQIGRGYTQRGALAADTLRIRTYGSTTFGVHEYVMGYAYDLNGRRRVLDHPSNVAPAAGAPQTYGYNGLTGTMDTVRSVLGHEYTFGYDLENRLVTYTFPNGSETHTYDNGGRRVTRVETVGGATWHDDTFAYDQRGRMLSYNAATAALMGGNATNEYSGLGGVVRSRVVNAVTGQNMDERFVVDALGRTRERDMLNVGIWSVDDGLYYSAYKNGAVDSIVEQDPCGGGCGEFFPRVTITQRDGGGTSSPRWNSSRDRTACPNRRPRIGSSSRAAGTTTPPTRSCASGRCIGIPWS